MYTYNKTKKTDEQWALKASRYFWPKSFTNKYVKNGLEYESTARNLYSKQSNQTVLECGLITDQNNPWLGYTPDGVVVNNENIPVKIIEIKCPFKGKSQCLNDIIKYLKFIIKHPDGSLSLKTNHVYYAQIQIGIVLLNVTICDFIIYSSYDNNYATIVVNYDDLYCRDMFFSLKIIYFERLLHEVCIYQVG